MRACRGNPIVVRAGFPMAAGSSLNLRERTICPRIARTGRLVPAVSRHPRRKSVPLRRASVFLRVALPRRSIQRLSSRGSFRICGCALFSVSYSLLAGSRPYPLGPARNHNCKKAPSFPPFMPPNNSLVRTLRAAHLSR